MFKNGDKVRFARTSDTELDQLTGKVIGKFAEDAYGAHYIVLFDSPYSKTDFESIAITQHCLELI